MYLSKLKITHYRKFNEGENEISFVASQSFKNPSNQEAMQIDIASNTTLVIGKNNAGKSTVINALETLIKNDPFCSSDFNYSYIRKYFSDYKNITEGPFIEFVLTIKLEQDSDDRITNLIPFMLIQDVNESEISITARYEISELDVFKDTVEKMLSNQKNDNKLLQTYI